MKGCQCLCHLSPGRPGSKWSAKERGSKAPYMLFFINKPGRFGRLTDPAARHLIKYPARWRPRFFFSRRGTLADRLDKLPRCAPESHHRITVLPRVEVFPCILCFPWSPAFKKPGRALLLNDGVLELFYQAKDRSVTRGGIKPLLEKVQNRF